MSAMAPICADAAVVGRANNSSQAQAGTADRQQQQHRGANANTNNAMANSRDAAANRGGVSNRTSVDSCTASVTAKPTVTSAAVTSSSAQAGQLRAKAESAETAAAEEEEAKTQPVAASQAPPGSDRDLRRGQGQGQDASKPVSRRMRLRERREARLKSAKAKYLHNVTELCYLQNKSGDYDYAKEFPNFCKKPPQALSTLVKSRPNCPASIIAEVADLVGRATPSTASSSSSSSPSPALSTPTTLGPSPTLAERLASPVIPTSSYLPATNSLSTLTSARSSTAPSLAPAATLPGLGGSQAAVDQPPTSHHPPPVDTIDYGPPVASSLPTSIPLPYSPANSDPASRQLPPGQWRGANTERVSPRTVKMLADKMRQEGEVVRRAHELAKEGLWTPKRLPKVAERPRGKTHWDTLLKEMEWLSVDFFQERNWKRHAAKVLAESAKEFVERWEEVKQKRREREERRKRNMAAFIAQQVNDFWEDIGTLAEAKARLPGIPIDVSCRTTTSIQHSGEKPGQSDPLEGVSENGILDDVDWDSDGEASDGLGDNESTISEQERFEAEECNGTMSSDILKEIKDLAYDSTQPIELLIPDEYPSTLTDPCLTSSEDGEESVDEDGDAEMAEGDGDTSNGVKSGGQSDCVDIRTLSLACLDQLIAETPLCRKAEERVLRVRMGTRQKRLYDDYLSGPTAQAAIDKGEVRDVARVVEDLRRICNHPRLSPGDDDWTGKEYLFVPSLASRHDVPRLFRSATAYDPWSQFDLDSLNMVFASHEATLTAFTSNSINKLAADPARLENLEKDPLYVNPPVWKPRARIALELTPVPSKNSFAVSGRPVPADIVKQHKGTPPPKKSKSDLALHSDSLRVIARFNSRRCRGLPLYGEDLVASLTVVNSVRPARTRFRGMGYVNCLNAGPPPMGSGTYYLNKASSRSNARGEFRYQTAALAKLVTHCYGEAKRLEDVGRVSHRQIVLEEGANEALLQAECHIIPILTKLTKTYSLPAAPSECRDRVPDRIPRPFNPWSERDQVQLTSAKLDKLLEILRDVRRRRGKTVVLCETDDALQSLRHHLARIKYPSIYLDPHLSKTSLLRQVVRYSKQSCYACLLACPSMVGPLGLTALGAVASITTVVFYDCPASLSQGFMSRWKPRLISSTSSGAPNLEILSLVCEGTVEDNISQQAVQDRLLCDLSSAAPPENGVMVKIRKQTLEELLGADKIKLARTEIDGCDIENVFVPPTDQSQRGPSIPHPSLLPTNLVWLWSGKDARTRKTSGGRTSPEENAEIFFDDDDLFDQEERAARLKKGFTMLQNYGVSYLDEMPSSPVDLLSQTALLDLEMEKGRWESNFQDVRSNFEEELSLLDSQPCLTYSYEDMQRSWHGRDGQPMPLWTPSVPAQLPPLQEEPFVEPFTTFLYKNELMDDSELPPVHIKKEPPQLNASTTAGASMAGLKRTASEASLGPIDGHAMPGAAVNAGGGSMAAAGSSSQLGYDSKPKLPRRDLESAPPTHPPRSLFDRHTPQQAKMRREKPPHQHKFRSTMPGGIPPIGGGAGGPINAGAAVAGLRHPLPRPQVEAENVAEWLIQEDWALLHAVRELLELPLNVSTMNPAHSVNWDMVSDMVNGVSRVFRGAKQCRARYETIVVPREEGRILIDVAAPPINSNAVAVAKNKKKKAAMKGIPLQPGMGGAQGKINKSQRTGQVFSSDGNTSWSKLFANRFEQLKAVANKRTPTVKPLMVNPAQKNSKHAAVLAESGISYEAPLNPIKVAANRAERIQKEKQRAQLDQQQQLAQQQRVAAAQNAANVAQQAAAAQRVAVSAPQLIQQQQQPHPQGAQQQHQAQAVVVGISQPGGTVGATAQQVIVQGSPSQIGRLTAVQQQQQIQQPQPVVASAQDIAGRLTAAAAQQQQQQQQAVVSVANLTQSQLQAAQKIAQQQIVQRGGQLVTTQGKTLTPAQINQLKQQALLKKQQEQQLKARQQQQQAGLPAGAAVIGATTSTGQKVSVAVTGAGPLATVPGGGAVAVSGAVTVVTQALASGQPKTHYVRQVSAGGAGGSKPHIRPITESEMRQLLKQQQLALAQQQGGGGGASGSASGTSSPQQQLGKAAQVASIQVPAGQNLTAQLLSQGIQIQTSGTGAGGAQVAHLVKAVQAPSVGTAGQAGAVAGTSAGTQSVAIPVANINLRGSATPQQMQLIQRQLLQRGAVKGAAGAGGTGIVVAGGAGQPKLQLSQVATGKGVQQLIVSQGGPGGTQKQLPPGVTVQQIQQIVKSVQQQTQQGNVQLAANPNIIPHAVLAKQVPTSSAASGVQKQQQPVQARVIPVSSAAAVAAARGQQIQVVSGSNPAVVAALTAAGRQVTRQASAAAASGVATTVAPNVTIDASSLPVTIATTSQLASALSSGSIKVASTTAQQILSLAGGQPISVAVRSPSIQQLQQQQVAQQQQQQAKLQVVTGTSGQQQQQQPPTSKTD